MCIQVNLVKGILILLIITDEARVSLPALGSQGDCDYMQGHFLFLD